MKIYVGLYLSVFGLKMPFDLYKSGQVMIGEALCLHDHLFGYQTDDKPTDSLLKIALVLGHLKWFDRSNEVKYRFE